MHRFGNSVTFEVSARIPSGYEPDERVTETWRFKSSRAGVENCRPFHGVKGMFMLIFGTIFWIVVILLMVLVIVMINNDL